MMTLEQIREKYQRAIHPPDPNCKKCRGEGEFWRVSQSEFFKDGYSPCPCIFFGDHTEETMEILSDFARKELKHQK